MCLYGVSVNVGTWMLNHMSESQKKSFCRSCGSWELNPGLQAFAVRALTCWTTSLYQLLIVFICMCVCPWVRTTGRLQISFMRLCTPVFKTVLISLEPSVEKRLSEHWAPESHLSGHSQCYGTSDTLLGSGNQNQRSTCLQDKYFTNWAISPAPKYIQF